MEFPQWSISAYVYYGGFMNRLYYADNLTLMRDRMKTASVDLIYLDPPFNSNRNYNLLYGKATGIDVPEARGGIF